MRRLRRLHRLRRRVITATAPASTAERQPRRCWCRCARRGYRSPACWRYDDERPPWGGSGVISAGGGPAGVGSALALMLYWCCLHAERAGSKSRSVSAVEPAAALKSPLPPRSSASAVMQRRRACRARTQGRHCRRNRCPGNSAPCFVLQVSVTGADLLGASAPFGRSHAGCAICCQSGTVASTTLVITLSFGTSSARCAVDPYRQAM